MKKIIFILTSSIYATLFAQGVNFDWAGSAGASNIDEGRCLAYDNSGNIILSGVFRNTVDFDFGPGITSLTSIGQYSTFVAKYDPAGSLIWVKKLDHTNVNFSNQVKAMTVDNNNNIILAGNFEYAFDADPGSGVSNLTSVGSWDLFAVKLDNNGNYIWGKSMGGPDTDAMQGVTTDDAGSIYLTGNFMVSADLDPGPGVANFTASGWRSVFLVKLTPSGVYRWANILRTGSEINARDIDVVNGTQPVLVGTFTDTMDADPTAGVNYFISNGYDDLFYQRTDSTGNVINTLRLGSPNSEFETQLVCLSNGDKIWTGIAGQVMDLDPGPGVVMSDPSGYWGNSFLVKLNANDEYLHSAQLVGGASQLFNSVDVASDGMDGIYWYGKYLGANADLNPTSGTFILPSVGAGSNPFVVKLDTAINFQWAKRIEGQAEATQIIANASFDVLGTGSFDGTIDADPTSGNFSLTSAGNKDIYLFKLKPCTYSYSTLNVNACYSYTNPSSTNTYYTSGTYTDYLMNAEGCDSIITINLTISNDTWSSTVAYLCPGETYTSPSGLYVWNSTGAYTDTIPNSGGCDSVIYVDLVYIPGSNFTVNVTATGLESQDLNGSWQWIDCDNSNQPIPGATSQSFYPADDGTYAVIIDNSNCIDTSDCIVFNFLSDNPQSWEEVNIYPNPTKDYIFIDAIQEPLSIEIFDMSGRQLNVREYSPLLDISHLASGTYVLKINWADSYSMHRIIRE